MPQGVGVQVPPSAPFFKVISIPCRHSALVVRRCAFCREPSHLVAGFLVTRYSAWSVTVDCAELLRGANVRSVWLQQCGPVWSSSGQALVWRGLAFGCQDRRRGAVLNCRPARWAELASGSWKRPNPLIERAEFRRFTPAKPRSPLDTFGPTQYRAPIVRLGVSSRRCMAV